MEPQDADHLLGKSNYGGKHFSSLLSHNNNITFTHLQHPGANILGKGLTTMVQSILTSLILDSDFSFVLEPVKKIKTEAGQYGE